MAARRSQVWLGLAALLLQLALPFLHALEVHRAFAEASAASVRAFAHSSPRALDSTTRTLSPAPVATHDEQSCPICVALSHALAATAEAAPVLSASESGPPIVLVAGQTPPSRDVASAEARAPPAAPTIAIS